MPQKLNRTVRTNEPMFTSGTYADIRSLNTPRILSHELQCRYLLSCKVKTIADENGCVCWHEELRGKYILSGRVFCSRAWKEYSSGRGSSSLHLILFHCS